MFERTKKFCDSFIDMGVPGFDLAVYKNGECVLRHMNGYSDLEEKVKINGSERYNIYSCSKPITVVAALILYDRGLYSLDDKLSDYMSEFKEMKVKTEDGLKNAEKPILIKHLFEMTAGFSYNTASDNLKKCIDETNGTCPTREVMKYLAKEPLLFEPGDRWNYSFCHDVLAALVEVISGEKFEDFVKSNIFVPLGMNSSTYMLPESELNTLSKQYRFIDGKAVDVGKNISQLKLGSKYASGGAGGISTTDDYIKFMEGLRKGLLLKPETVKLMSTDRLTDHQRRTYWLNNTHGYGLGVRCAKKDAERFVDFGWDGMACAFMAVDLENDITVYFACHLISSPVQGIRYLLYSLIRADLLDDSEFESVKKDLKEMYNYEWK